MKKINRDSKMSNNVGGLYVKQGRLMNERPDGMTGIQKQGRLMNERPDGMTGIQQANMRDMF
jgi:hypothetical protein